MRLALAVWNRYQVAVAKFASLLIVPLLLSMAPGDGIDTAMFAAGDSEVGAPLADQTNALGAPVRSRTALVAARSEFGGEYEVKFDYRRNFALDKPASDDLLRFDQELQLRWHYQPNDGLTLFLEGKVIGEHPLYAGGGARRSEKTLERGETWLRLENLFGKSLQLQIGRQNFEEPRQWWWDDDLDAVALRYRGSSLSWEWAVARQVAQLDFLRSRIEPEEEGVWRVLSRASWRYQPGHQFDLFFLHHRDLSSTPGVGASIRASREDESDAQLSWGGLRASGKEPVGGFGLLSYWADLGLVAGRELFLEVDDAPHQRKIVSQRQRHKIFGRAVDVGARWATEFAGRPIFTLSYAVGSGDRRLNRGADHGFRQTGLQSNDEEFRTYGELLRPELANLRIPTVAIAFPFMVKSQIEIAYRNFRQLYAAPFLRDARIDAKPTGKRKNIGNEWMLSALIKEWKNFEIEIVGAAFRAGSAYGTASGTMAYSFFTKLSYEF